MKSESNNLSWLEIVEIGSVIGAVGGTLASLIIKEAFFLASIPLSVAVGLNLFNRRELLNSIETKNQEQINLLIADSQDYSTNLEHLAQLIHKQEQSLEDLKQNYQQEIEQIHETNIQLNEQLIDTKLDLPSLSKVEGESIASNLKSAEFVYKQGISIQEQDQQQALEMFTKAIHFNPQYADAYYHRALILSALADNKKAIEDFRLAAKWYFQQGDLDSYQKAKDMDLELHALNANIKNKPQKPAETIRLSNLFS